MRQSVPGSREGEYVKIDFVRNPCGAAWNHEIGTLTSES